MHLPRHKKVLSTVWHGLWVLTMQKMGFYSLKLSVNSPLCQSPSCDFLIIFPCSAQRRVSDSATPFLGPSAHILIVPPQKKPTHLSHYDQSSAMNTTRSKVDYRGMVVLCIHDCAQISKGLSQQSWNLFKKSLVRCWWVLFIWCEVSHRSSAHDDHEDVFQK